jgi:3-phenylpropionate/trans-cinnamate dioxygenase ferredoxin reductase subunit
MPNHIVIVGGGQAGFQVASALRGKKFDGPITILAEEPVLPYQRPPLSKEYLKGEVAEHQVLLRPQEFYATRNIEVRLNARATAIDRAKGRVALANDETLGYDCLVLATGARVRPLPVPGTELAGVVYLRTLADSAALKPLLAAARNVVVIGGGFIGLECASVSATLGRRTVVLEAADRLMGRVVSPVLSAYYHDLHRSRDVDVRLGAAVTELHGVDGHVTKVRSADGSDLPADLVIIGIGIVPNDDLAAAAGLPCDRGIVVDAMLRTVDPNIYAIGDCAAFPHPMAQVLVRLESVQNAVDQGKTVADAILGEAKPYTAVPWFWSDQYDAHLQIAGLCHPYDATVTIGDLAAGSFSLLYFRSEALVGIDSVNRPADHVAARKLFAAGKVVTLTQARAPGFDLKAATK